MCNRVGRKFGKKVRQKVKKIKRLVFNRVLPVINVNDLFLSVITEI